MNYIELSIVVRNKVFTEILEAELAELDFESFVNENFTLKAYATSEAYNDSESRAILEQYQDEIESIVTREIEHQNWNSVWESNYQPVMLDKELFIGASFHEVDPSAAFNIILEPNMSFGTGHHPTTEMMLRAMFKMDLNNKSVLDFGCGSAILSIYADLKKAFGIGIEIDAHAADAARLNLALNNANNFTIVTGGVETISNNQFDLIAANINRNVIEECLETFVKSSKIGTRLFCSGFLQHDIDGLSTMLTKSKYRIDQVNQIGEWAMIETTYLG
ncbi:MAG: 50S ribosomal protein L11 methyltransferase [Salibacteraceae bacterium]|nr:50S ribosomal protein L11 methyltransferase [Salibacteraceae bacterium]